MNIKSLLLGSAAALVAVSGARAADAVVIAEPEPMEYVRICDTYGVGFYYIPGTETCLKVSGYLRYDINAGRLGLLNVVDKEDGDDLNDTWDKKARFTLRVDSRAETELGTLRTYAAIEFNFDTDGTGTANGDNYDGYSFQSGTGIDLNQAYIELGGFRVGKTDSMFSTFTGFSSGVLSDGLVPYGPFDTHQIAYTFTGGNGFTAAVALEEGGGDWEFGPTNPGDDYALDTYVPHVVGGIGWTGGWGGVSAVAGYDAVWGEGAIKGRVDFNASDAISLFVMGAWASVDEDLTGGFGDSPNFYAPWGGEWAVWVGGAWKFNEKATFNFEVGYDDFEDFSVAANVDYELVTNFHIIPEISYLDQGDDTLDGLGILEENARDEWGARLRFQANFGG
jgi:hypothetical protein